MPPLTSSSATGLTITNPLVLYRALLATKYIEPDPAQHRLALHLQKLYHRLKDYAPQKDYEVQLKAVKQAVNDQISESDESSLAAPGHPLRRNPLFSHLFRARNHRNSLALTRVLSNYEAAKKLDSPRGLMLHGEVGTGKSMLLDLLAESLPNHGKRRWHFNTFMLETISRLESLRISQSLGTTSEYSLLWLAKDMVEKSPILFLDEFQLPDRAASKILSHLLTTFFQLGGVLIASSNRMPEELAKASGVEFAPPPRSSMKNWFGLGDSHQTSPHAGNSEFVDFLEVLKARCEIWDMEGARDWRRRDVLGTSSRGPEVVDLVDSVTQSQLPISLTETAVEERPAAATDVAPSKYFLSSIDSEDSWKSAILGAFLDKNLESPPWQPATISIYGRKVVVTQQYQGVVNWTFEALCKGILGPADYITMASTFHTFIIDEVPVLNLSQKNEARRLITLLDALYESKCKLIIRAEAGPDELFFPETMESMSSQNRDNKNDDEDAVYPETFSEIYQDQVSPFRPNVSVYTDQPNRSYDPVEDSDFGDPFAAADGSSTAVDFGQTSSFTGEDERFAYKRARSRLWEMCGSRWHTRSEPGWWKPLLPETRHWERSSGQKRLKTAPEPSERGDVTMGPSIELEELAGLHGRDIEARKQSLMDDRQSEAPKFGWMHAWGMIKWGKRAGVWGQGPDGLQTKTRDGKQDKDSSKT